MIISTLGHVAMLPYRASRIRNLSIHTANLKKTYIREHKAKSSNLDLKRKLEEFKIV